MSFDTIFENFGIPGIILFGLGTLAYKMYQKYNIYIASIEDLNNYDPQKTLWEIWENGESVADNHWNNYNYVKKIQYNDKPAWEINLPSIENGDVFIYTGITELPLGLDDGKYFINVKIKNIKSNISVFFHQKRFYGTREEHIASKYKDIVDQPIMHDGVHYFEPKCSIGDTEGEEQYQITKEQIGIYIKPDNDISINNLIIEEAYIGKKCWKYNLLPYISNKYNLVFEPK